MKKHHFYTLLLFFNLICACFVFSQKVDSVKLIERKIEQAKSDTTRVRLFYDLADLYLEENKNRYDFYMGEGYKLSQKAGYISGVTTFFEKKSYAYLWSGLPQEGKAFAQRGAMLALKNKDTVTYLNTRYYEAAANMYMGNYVALNDVVSNTLERIKNRTFFTEKAKLYSLMVQYYNRIDLSKSFEYILLEYNCLKKNKKPAEMMSVYNEFASFYTAVMDYDMSIYYSKKALQEAHKVKYKDNYNLAFIHSNIANIYLNKKSYPLAKRHIDITLEYSKKVDNDALMSKNNLLLAQYFTENKDYTKAFQYSTKIESSNLPEYRLNGLLYGAVVLNKLSKYKEAEQKLNAIDKNILNEYIPDYKMIFYQEQANLNKGLKNFEKAFDYQEKLLQLQTIMNENKFSLKNIMLQSKFQLKQKNSELERLKIEQQQNRLENQRQKTKVNILIATLALLLVIAGVFVWVYQFKKRRNFIFGLSRIQLQNEIHEKELLIKEIHHRVKNNFQLILSMISLQATDKKISKNEFIEQTNSRIMALSKIHEKLYLNNSLYQLDINLYIKGLAKTIQLTLLNSDKNIQFQVSNEVVMLNIDTIMPVGLIVNELITNSIKYAFETVTSPLIEINLTKMSTSRFQLIYKDNGNVRNDTITNIGVGMNIVNALCNQINTIPKTNLQNGFYFEINFNSHTHQLMN